MARISREQSRIRDGDYFKEDNKQHNAEKLDLELKTSKEVRNKNFKIKQLIAVPKNVQVKKWIGRSKNDSTQKINISSRTPTCRILIAKINKTQVACCN